MDFIRNLLLIIIFILTCTTNLVNCCEIDYAKKHPETISSTKFSENDILNSKENELNLSAINNQTQLNTRRNQNNQFGSSYNPAIVSQKQIQKIIKYIQNQLYLENNTELALLFLFHQIQPNAP